jgi:hypothetical protein
VSGLRLFNTAAGQHRARHAGVKHCVSARLEPGAEQRDVSGPSDAVSAFNDNQLATVFFLFDARQRRSIRVV